MSSAVWSPSRQQLAPQRPFTSSVSRSAQCPAAATRSGAAAATPPPPPRPQRETPAITAPDQPGSLSRGQLLRGSLAAAGGMMLLGTAIPAQAVEAAAVGEDVAAAAGAVLASPAAAESFSKASWLCCCFA
jgi:hypothetical protein